MIRIKQALRLQRIFYILARNGLDRILLSMGLFPSMRFFVYLNPWNWGNRRKEPIAVALRKTLEELGPIFVKFGQALSTRPDILPVEIALELSKLQDKVPPFPSIIARKIIEESFSRPLDAIFSEFEPEVLASASISQVHAATLLTGQSVVIKVLRPGIRSLIEKDLSLMLAFAELLNRYWPLAKRFKPIEIVQEFSNHLINELDLRREAANASQLKRNFDQSPLLYVPAVYWDYIHENVMVMERIHGIPVSDIQSLRQFHIDLEKLAQRGVEIFFTQVFRDCFFHADMHPGNIFVSPLHPDNPQYICVDFGIVGTLSNSDKRYLAENLLAFFNRDYKRVALLHVESGWVNPATRVEDFEAAIRTLCEPVINRPLKEISFAELALRLFQVARRFEMEVQPQLVLLQKTLLAVEGLGRQLYPDLNLWVTAKPFLEKWLKKQMGPRALLRSIQDTLPFLSEKLPEFPQLVFEALHFYKNEKQSQLHQQARVAKKIQATNRSTWSFGMGAFFTLTVLGSFFWFTDQTLAIPGFLTGIAGMLTLFLFKRS